MNRRIRIISLITLSLVFIFCFFVFHKEAKTPSPLDKTALIGELEQYLNDKLSYEAGKIVFSEEPIISPLGTRASDLLDYVTGNRNSFTEHFSGVYVKANTLMICVTEYQEEYPVLLNELLKDVDYQFIEVLYLKSDLDLTTLKINYSIGDLNSKKIAGELSGDTLFLSEHYPCCSYRTDLNRIIIRFKAEEDTEEFNKLVALFEQYIGSYEGVIYEGQPDFEPAVLF